MFQVSRYRFDLEAISRILLTLPYDRVSERQAAEYLRNDLELQVSIEETGVREKIYDILRR